MTYHTALVRHTDIEAYLDCGWTLITRMADCHHGIYRALMQAPKGWPYK